MAQPTFVETHKVVRPFGIGTKTASTSAPSARPSTSFSVPSPASRRSTTVTAATEHRAAIVAACLPRSGMASNARPRRCSAPKMRSA